MSEELDKTLEAARADGTLDSCGRFTLDRMRASRLCRKYTLPDPRMYVLKLVQSAVAGGAPDVRLECPLQIELCYGGRRLTRQNLELLLGAPLELDFAGPERFLGHLAVGIHAALGLNPDRIEIDGLDQGQRIRLTVGGDGHHWERLEDNPESLNRISIHGLDYDAPGCGCAWAMVRDFMGLFSGRRMSPEEYVQSRCALSPVPVLLNGRAVNGGNLTRNKLRRQPDGSACVVFEGFIRGRRPSKPTSRWSGGNWSVPRHGGTWERYLVAPDCSGHRTPGRTSRNGDQRWLWASRFPHDLKDCRDFDPVDGTFESVPGIRMEGCPTLPCFAAARCENMAIPVGSLYGIFWMMDGVVVEHETEPPEGCPPFAQFIVSAEELKTDASQFPLVRNQVYRQARGILAQLAPARA